MTRTLRVILAVLNRNHRKAAMPEPTPANDSGPCPNCRHSRHLPGTECEVVVDHGPSHWHRCLCLARPGAALPCPPQMTCQGGTLGYSDIWYLQHGHSLWSADGVVSPEVLRLDPTRSPAAAQPAPADRAAILREAADLAESLRQFERTTGPRASAQVSENVGILRVADELRRMADEVQQPQPEVDPAAALIAGMPLPKGAADVVRAAGFPLGTRVTADVVREAMRKRQTASGHDVAEPGPADA